MDNNIKQVLFLNYWHTLVNENTFKQWLSQFWTSHKNHRRPSKAYNSINILLFTIITGNTLQGCVLTIQIIGLCKN